MDRKWKVILCGASFGQFYMEALHRLSEHFEVVGLYARESERNVNCAKTYNIKLYTELLDIPEDVELAIVVMRSGILGGIGNDVVKHFLSNGIHVIQEFPIHPEDVEQHYKLARKNNVNYYIGDFYLKLPQVIKFIKIAKLINVYTPILHIQMGMAVQLSFPAVMMLREILDNKNIKLKCVTNNETMFQVLVGNAGETSLTFEVQSEMDLLDPDSSMCMFQSVTLIYESGRLILDDPFGPIYWYPRVKTSTSLYVDGKPGKTIPKPSGMQVATQLGNYEAVDYVDIQGRLWIEAIQKDLMNMLSGIEDRKLYTKKAQKDIVGAKQWNEVNKIVGFPKKVERSHVTEDVWEKVKNIVKSMR